MTKVEVTWRGGDIKRGAMHAAARGLFQAGEYLLSEAIPQTPIDDGILRSSGAVSADAQGTTVAVSFNTPYAVKQHEELSYRHPKGGKAKYLEDPFHAGKQRMQSIIARAVRTQLGG